MLALASYSEPYLHRSWLLAGSPGWPLSQGRERWGKKQFSEFEQHQIRALRQSLDLDHPLVPLEVVTRDKNPRRSAASAR